MDFSDKLNFLMNITQTSNKELAANIFVDRSLISLLRNGKRGIPHNQNHIKNMAYYFAQCCTADFQRHALSEMLGQISIRSSMPTEILAEQLMKWLQGDRTIAEELIDGVENAKPKPVTNSFTTPVPLTSEETTFYYGNSGRRKAMRYMMDVIQKVDTPASILVASDDNLDWLFEDYLFANEVQTYWIEALQKNLTMKHIIPSMNFINSYVESLQYWLPIYITGQADVYYYPRLRDNLYLHSFIILPDYCVQATTGIGLGNQNHITLTSTHPQLVKAYTHQYQEYLSLCRPALITHTTPRDFFYCFEDMFSRKGLTIQKVTPLSASTIPRELLELCIKQTDIPGWKMTFQMYINQIPKFEERLMKQGPYIDISRLATAEEVRSQTIAIATPYKTCNSQPVYTPETYILHLQNILRLMDQYENYYFIPFQEETLHDYNLFVNEDGLALLVRNSPPTLMLELRRPEMVQACREYLMRMAEQKGYDGIQREKIRLQLKSLIRELQN